MSLIEQAAKRLQQLRSAGVEFPTDAEMPAIPVSQDAKSDIGVRPENHGAAGKALAEKSAPPRAREPAAPKAGFQHVQSKRVEIDLFALAEKFMVTPEAPRTKLADEYRVLKRPLIANAMGKGAAPVVDGNLIMVTSALPREGKSYTAVNLAMSIAMELDTTVMLVDADVARPSVLNVLGLPPASGLLDVLTNPSVGISDVLLRTNVEKLTLLPSGNPRERATELLASDGMVALVREIADRYPDRIIIFDSPPLLMTTESRVLATHMGQIVMVVQAERTSQSDVKRALAMIESCPVKMVILNQARGDASGTYSYGYGYGYGGGQGEAA